MDFDDVPKYKKKRIYKGEKRSNHKHNYAEALVRCYVEKGDFEVINRVEYCTICGRINNTFGLESESLEGKKLNRLLTNEEKLEKYKYLKVFKINTLCDKYVNV